ncbi:hypothetical protein [Lacticaseibacillus zeae]|uniref:hypothetical protein n=1 Tax=Lacticaseibacillus zeae TaxID=57037 RepID=UPI0014852B06|nr:hypothetical protein [Lacticaseibacillus zeae]
MSDNIKSISKVQREINELDALLDGNDPGFEYHIRKIPTPLVIQPRKSKYPKTN